MDEVLQFRVSLIDSKPEIWRRLLLDPRLTLEQMHTAIQCSFGWENSHLHQFHAKGGLTYMIPSRNFGGFGGGALDERVVDERKVLLGTVFAKPRTVIGYEYDFGDSWMHAVEFEGRQDPEKVEYPFDTFLEKGRGMLTGKVRAAMCIAAEQAGPPEDCGGIHQFQRLLALRNTPSTSKARKTAADRELLEWASEWDPLPPDLGFINQNLGRIRVKKAFAQ